MGGAITLNSDDSLVKLSAPGRDSTTSSKIVPSSSLSDSSSSFDREQGISSCSIVFLGFLRLQPVTQSIIVLHAVLEGVVYL